MITLEKYKGLRSRYTCPCCGHHHQFTRYINTDTNEHVNEIVGKCNREIACGYHLKPKEWYLQHPTERNRLPDLTDLVKPRIVEKKELCYLPNDILRHYNGSSCVNGNIQNSLLYYLFKSTKFGLNFWLAAFKRYYVLTYFSGCVFLQVDINNKVRSGKLMKYNYDTGHRIKTGGGAPPVDWLHSRAKRQGLLPDEWQLSQCLFGEHLLNIEPTKEVMLVESEKTAVIMSLYSPQFLWLATGGLQNFKTDVLRVLKGRRVVAVPDAQCWRKWQEKSLKIYLDIGLDIFVSKMIEDSTTACEKKAGFDIADLYLRGQWIIDD